MNKLCGQKNNVEYFRQFCNLTIILQVAVEAQSLSTCLMTERLWVQIQLQPGIGLIPSLLFPISIVSLIMEVHNYWFSYLMCTAWKKTLISLSMSIIVILPRVCSFQTYSAVNWNQTHDLLSSFREPPRPTLIMVVSQYWIKQIEWTNWPRPRIRYSTSWTEFWILDQKFVLFLQRADLTRPRISIGCCNVWRKSVNQFPD